MLEHWDLFLSEMYAAASADFRNTDLYHELHRRLRETEARCRDTLGEDNRQFLEQWAEELLSLDAAESTYLYERGYRDCAAVLRRITII